MYFEYAKSIKQNAFIYKITLIRLEGYALMARCDVCGKEIDLPFRCFYCQRHCCFEHRLPENHNCLGKFRERTYTTPIQETPPKATSTAEQMIIRQNGKKFNKKALRAVLVATSLVFIVLVFLLTSSFLTTVLSTPSFSSNTGYPWSTFSPTSPILPNSPIQGLG